MIQILLKNFEKIPEIKEKIFYPDVYEFNYNLFRNKSLLIYYVEEKKDIEEIKEINKIKNDKSYIIALVKDIEYLEEILDSIDDYVLINTPYSQKMLLKKMSTIIYIDKKEETEEEIASNIQNIMLNEMPPYSSILDIATHYIESGVVGGDVYDFQSMSNNYYGVFIADVSGHGPSSALIAAIVKLSFKTFGADVNNPAWVLESINRIIYPAILQSGKFVTSAYLIFSQNKIEFCNAGHVSPLLYRDGEFIEIPITNTIMGVYKNLKFENRELDIKKDDLIFLYTDGLTESKNRKNEFFGKERLKRIIEENSKKSSEEIKNIAYKEIMDFTEGFLNDDITFIVIKVK